MGERKLTESSLPRYQRCHASASSSLRLMSIWGDWVTVHVQCQHSVPLQDRMSSLCRQDVEVYAVAPFDFHGGEQSFSNHHNVVILTKPLLFPGFIDLFLWLSRSEETYLFQHMLRTNVCHYYVVISFKGRALCFNHNLFLNLINTIVALNCYCRQQEF